MSKALTLDELLNNYGRLYWHNMSNELANVITPAEAETAKSVGREQAKQAILQWVADEVVGEAPKLGNFDDTNQYYAVKESWDNKRQILKHHGWKPKGKS